MKKLLKSEYLDKHAKGRMPSQAKPLALTRKHSAAKGQRKDTGVHVSQRKKGSLLTAVNAPRDLRDFMAEERARREGF